MRVPARLRPLVGRDAIAAFAVVAGLYALARVAPVQPLAVPGYLLLVSYDAIEGAVPALPDYCAVGFPLYLYAPAAVAAATGAALWGIGGYLAGYRVRLVRERSG